MRFGRRREVRPGIGDRLKRRRRIRRRIALTLFALLVVAPALFIGTQCSGGGVQARTGPTPPFPMPTREESLTFLTLPEWSIVYSTEEYARHLARAAPSSFPYFGSAAQYWRYVDGVCEVTSSEYPFNTGYQVMLGVIGTSFSAELVLKGLYEKTIGRITEWISSHDTPEDRFAARTAAEYGAFMHNVPWYEFPFATKLRALWGETPMGGPHLLRKWERRLALSAEYAGKAVYGWMIRKATQTAYDPESLEIQAWIAKAPATIFADKRVHAIHTIGPDSFIVRLPRYEPFTDVVRSLAKQGVEFLSIAGNDEILITAVGVEPREALPAGQILASLPILTEPPARRHAIRVPVNRLTDLLAWLPSRGITLEHVYDY